MDAMSVLHSLLLLLYNGGGDLRYQSGSFFSFREPHCVDFASFSQD